MTEYVRNTLSGSNAPVNAELEKIKTALDSKLDRKPVQGQANQMEEDLDMNGNTILNLSTAPSGSNGIVTRDSVYLKEEIDSKDAATLEASKAYADSVIIEESPVLISRIESVETDISNLATVSTTGSYNDLSDVPPPSPDLAEVIPQTGGGVLTARRINELRDGDVGYTLPLANSVSANSTIIITQPDRYVSNEPVVTASGSDTITSGDGADTSITFNQPSSISITLTSDGVSNWSL
jgi:hypothetical protein